MNYVGREQWKHETYPLQVWFKNRRAKCRQSTKPDKKGRGSKAGEVSSSSKSSSPTSASTPPPLMLPDIQRFQAPPLPPPPPPPGLPAHQMSYMNSLPPMNWNQYAPHQEMSMAHQYQPATPVQAPYSQADANATYLQNPSYYQGMPIMMQYPQPPPTSVMTTPPAPAAPSMVAPHTLPHGSPHTGAVPTALQASPQNLAGANQQLLASPPQQLESDQIKAEATSPVTPYSTSVTVQGPQHSTPHSSPQAPVSQWLSPNSSGTTCCYSIDANGTVHSSAVAESEQCTEIASELQPALESL